MKRSHFLLNVLPLIALVPSACQDATGPKATPIADAGLDQAAMTGELVQLDGSGSFVPDGDLPTFLWSFQSKPDGSRAMISDAATLSASFTPDLVGTYVVSLTVSVGTLHASDESEISVAAGA
ncbi:MAG: PKD domain-containing protein, partial [Gemmatimonadota bacterium]